MRGWVRGVAALLALTLLMAWPGAAASADGEIYWRGADCGTGKLSHAALDGHYVVVSGAAQLCPDTDPGEGTFAVATFIEDDVRGVIHINAIRAYAVGQDRPFAIGVLQVPRQGVCLLASPTQRIACAEIRVGPGDTVAFRLISPTDPLVDVPVDDLVDPGRVSGPCNSCF